MKIQLHFFTLFSCLFVSFLNAGPGQSRVSGGPEELLNIKAEALKTGESEKVIAFERAERDKKTGKCDRYCKDECRCDDRRHNRTALHFAARDANPELVAAFLECPKYYGNVTALDADGMDPLTRCLEALYHSEGVDRDYVGHNKDDQVVTALLLVKANADPKLVVPETGDTALLMAANRGLLPVVDALIKAGADSNACNKKGYFPLWHVALNLCFKGAQPEELVEVLVKGGAEPNFASKKGTALEHCRLDRGGARVAWALIKHGATRTEAFSKKQEWLAKLDDEELEKAAKSARELDELDWSDVQVSTGYFVLGL